MHPTVGRERVKPRKGRGIAEGSAFDSDCRRFFDRVLVEGVCELAVVRAVGEVCGSGNRAGASDGPLVETEGREEWDFHPEFES